MLHSKTINQKTLSTGYYTGIEIDQTQTCKFKDFINTQNNQSQLNETYKQTNIVKEQALEVTAKKEIQNLERDVLQLQSNLLAKTKDAIFIKNEVKKSLVSNKNPSSKDIIYHYVDKLKAEIQRIFNKKEQQSEVLKKRIQNLQNENLQLTQNILSMEQKLTHLEQQFGAHQFNQFF